MYYAAFKKIWIQQHIRPPGFLWGIVDAKLAIFTFQLSRWHTPLVTIQAINLCLCLVREVGYGSVSYCSWFCDSGVKNAYAYSNGWPLDMHQINREAAMFMEFSCHYGESGTRRNLMDLLPWGLMLVSNKECAASSQGQQKESIPGLYLQPINIHSFFFLNPLAQYSARGFRDNK